MAGTRGCEQCGAEFAPRREHGRFCSPGCRAAWNREHSGDAAAEVRALEWSVLGMHDVTERLSWSRPAGRAVALGMAGDAVWWVTIVDARLVRHYLGIYDGVLAARSPAGRRAIEGTLAGLRFVRNQMSSEAGRAGFIGPPSRAADQDGVIAGWTWLPMPGPARGSLPPQVRSWELTRHQAYETWLAGRTVGQVFGRVTGFLDSAAAQAISAAHNGALALPNQDS